MSDALKSTLAMAKEYYGVDGNSCGGNLHIVLDDGNIEDEFVRWCRDNAASVSDARGVDLANKLLTITEDMRHEVYCLLHGIAWYPRGLEGEYEDDQED